MLERTCHLWAGVSGTTIHDTSAAELAGVRLIRVKKKGVHAEHPNLPKWWGSARVGRVKVQESSRKI